jgi:hypothetical protein
MGRYQMQVDEDVCARDTRHATFRIREFAHPHLPIVTAKPRSTVAPDRFYTRCECSF